MIYESTKSLVISGYTHTILREVDYTNAYFKLPDVFAVVANYIIVSNKNSAILLGSEYAVAGMAGQTLQNIIRPIKEEVNGCIFSLFYVKGWDGEVSNPGYFTIETDKEDITQIINRILEINSNLEIKRNIVQYELPQMSFDKLLEEQL